MRQFARVYFANDRFYLDHNRFHVEQQQHSPFAPMRSALSRQIDFNFHYMLPHACNFSLGSLNRFGRV